MIKFAPVWNRFTQNNYYKLQSQQTLIYGHYICRYGWNIFFLLFLILKRRTVIENLLYPKLRSMWDSDWTIEFCSKALLKTQLTEGLWSVNNLMH